MKEPLKRKNEGNVKTVDISDIVPNTWNPNYQTSSEFNMLLDNVSKVGFVDPPLVVEVNPQDHGGSHYRIIDGEHRYLAARELKFEKIPVIIADPKVFDEKTQKLQTVRMNKIRGQLDTKKFNKLVDNLIKSGEVHPDEAAFALGFADEDEFDLIREAMRETLPSKEAKKEFDKRTKEAKNVDEIYKIVMQLMKKYSDGLQANFMIIASGHGRNLWVRLDGRFLRDFEAKARECLDAGVTFDSFVLEALNQIEDTSKFIEEHKDNLVTTDDEFESIDDFFEYDVPISYEEQQEIVENW